MKIGNESLENMRPVLILPEIETANIFGINFRVLYRNRTIRKSDVGVIENR